MTALVRAQAGGAIDDAVAATVYRVTEGNPLFVDEMVRLLRARGAIDWLPDGIADTIRGHLALLDESVRAVLAVAAVFGREVQLPSLAAVAGRSPDELGAAVAAAVAAGLLVELGGAPPSVRFSHVLVQEVLYRDLPPSRRGAVHAEIAAALASLPPTRIEEELATLAHHALEGQLAGAIDWAHRAAARRRPAGLRRGGRARRARHRRD